MTDPRLHELRSGLEDAAVFLGILSGVYRSAGDTGMEQLLTAARNKATASLERAGFPFQEDPANPKGT